MADQTLRLSIRPMDTARCEREWHVGATIITDGEHECVFDATCERFATMEGLVEMATAELLDAHVRRTRGDRVLMEVAHDD